MGAMSDHERRRFEDTPWGKLAYSWPAIVGIFSVIYAMAKGATILTTLADASSKANTFQEAQIAINTKLQTLLDTHENRLSQLETWRDRSNRWNKRDSDE